MKPTGDGQRRNVFVGFEVDDKCGQVGCSLAKTEYRLGPQSLTPERERN